MEWQNLSRNLTPRFGGGLSIEQIELRDETLCKRIIKVPGGKSLETLRPSGFTRAICSKPKCTPFSRETINNFWEF